MLFLLGYGLAIPVLFRFSTIIEKRNSLGLFGHQLGVIIAGIGWALRGKLIVMLLHLVWIVVAKIWFSMAAKPAKGTSSSKKSGAKGKDSKKKA